MPKIVFVFAALLLAGLLLSGCSTWDRPGVKIEGITAHEKLQAIANSVSEKHAGTVVAIYVQSSSATPEFIVAVTVQKSSITTQAKATEVQDAFSDAMATLLRLTTSEVLASEPSIRYVGISPVIDGQLTQYYTVAADLKAMAPDASDKAWLAKLQPVPPLTSTAGMGEATPAPQQSSGNSNNSSN